MKPIAAFDLESADIFLESGTMVYPSSFKTDVRIWGPERDFVIRNPGISIAATATEHQIDFFESNTGIQRISRTGQMIKDLVEHLYNLSQTHTLVPLRLELNPF